MSKLLVGDAKAHIPGKGAEKPRYLTIGALFKDSENGRLSLKIDTLPIAESGWTGWVNVFERDGSGNYKKAGSAPSTEIPEDDVPF